MADGSAMDLPGDLVSSSSTPPVSAVTTTLPGTHSHTLGNLAVGCKLFVRKPADDGEVELRKAEILSIRERPKPRTRRIDRSNGLASSEKGERAPGKDDTATGSASVLTAEEAERERESRLDYYVHYVEFNKRLDEWVSSERMDLGREVEWPKAKVGGQKKKDGSATPTPADSSSVSRPGGGAAALGTPTTAQKTSTDSLLKKVTSRLHQPKLEESLAAREESKIRAINKQLGQTGVAVLPVQVVGEEGEDGEMEEDEQDSNDLGPVDGTSPVPAIDPPKVYSREQEIEKLRTSGSMTQNVDEISRVKNLDKIQMGKHIVEAWYFSPYPVEYAHTPMLYICEFCLSFFANERQYERHRTHKCGLLHPPGNEIYRNDDGISFFEIDGRRQKTWCRNLCLLSKLFLDHKTLYYDVDPFLFYVMTMRDAGGEERGHHMIGYFSKEKDSAESYNLACILTLPQHQRQSFGRLLIEFSYELSRREGKLGSPEKPLSDLGLLSYRAYWAEEIIEILLHSKEEVTIDELAHKTGIVHADVMHTCQQLQILKYHRGQHVICLTDSIIQRHQKSIAKRRRRINPEKLIWKPPTFDKWQLRYI